MLDDRSVSPGSIPPSKAWGPLFLVGAPRSGTTLVYKMLCLHPDTAWISNWIRIFPGVRPLAALNVLPSRFPDVRYRAWFGDDSNAYVYGRRRGLRQRLIPTPAEGEPVFRRAGLGEAEITDSREVPAKAVEDLRRSVRAIQRYSGASYFVNKRVANNRRIPLLAQAFPSARFLEIVRDGRAVANSLSMVDWWPESTIWWNGTTPMRWEEEGGDPWELCARSWVEELKVTSRGLSMVTPSRVMKISYEEFVTQPLEVLSAIQRFAGLPDSEEWFRALARCRLRPADDAWRTQLPERALETVEAVQSDMLRLHGYPIDSRPSSSRAGLTPGIEAPRVH